MTNNEIANEIKKIRLERGLSLTQMAKVIKVAGSTIFLAETGKIGGNVVKKYNDFFGTNFRIDKNLCNRCGQVKSLSRAGKYVCWDCNKSTWIKKKGYNQNPVTYMTKMLICLAVYDKEPISVVASDLNRDIEDCQQILEECKKNKFYKKIVVRCRF